MADPQLDQLKKEIDDLNKRIAALGGEFFRDIDQAIASFGGGLKGAEAALKSLRKEIDGLDTDTNYFYETLKKVTKELKGQSSYNNDITNAYSKLSSLANKLKYDQDGISELSKKDLENIQKKVKIQQKDLTSFLKNNKEAESSSLAQQDRYIKQLGRLEDKLEKKWELTQDEYALYDSLEKKLEKERSIYDKIFQVNKEVKNLLEDQEVGINKLLTATQRRLNEEIKIQNTLGLSGKIVDGIVGSLGKLGISSIFFENLKEDMRDAAKSADKWKVISVATTGIIKGLGEALNDPITKLSILLKIAGFFFKAAFNANSQVVQLGKSLGASSEGFRENLVRIENSSSNLNVNTKNLVAAFDELVTATGYVGKFSADTLETQIMLTKQFGLTAEEAAGVFRFSVLTGKSSKAVNDAMLGAFAATRNSLKAGVPFKAAMAEAAKVSGALASNLQNNPKRIVEAVVQAKALGTTLEQTAKQGEALLNFETSIESELKAELLTGRQLNLERARAAALAGDQITLAEELAKNMGTIEEFDRLNVLEKKALAEAAGLTTDELAKQLQNQKIARETGKSIAQVTKEQLAEEQKRQDIQTKFNAAVEKLQSIIGNLVAGPLGSFVDSLSNGLTIVTKIFGYFGKIFSVIKSIPGVGGLLSGIASVATISALMALVAKSLAKGTIINPMITKDISSALGGGSVKDALLGKKSGGQFTKGGGRVPKGGRTGGLLKGAGKFLTKGSVLGILGGLGLDYASEAAANAGNEGLAKGLGLGSGILGGAGTGALIGSIIPGIGTAVGGLIGGALGGISSLMADDLISQGNYGKRTLLAPEGAIKLNNNDTVIAGTDLGGGNNQSIPGPVIDLTPMIAAINEVKASVTELSKRPVYLYMDGKQVGSNLVQGSYKLA